MYRLLTYIVLILTACKGFQNVKDGTQAYQFKRYALAIELLNDELEEGEDIQKRLMMARAYDHLGLWEEAEREYRQLVSQREEPSFVFEYANVLTKQMKYGQALQLYKMLKTEASLDYILDAKIRACEMSLEWYQIPDTLVHIDPVRFNTKYSEYGVSLLDGSLVFTTDRMDIDGSDIYDWTGLGYSDLWIAQADETNAQRWNVAINTSYNEGNAMASSDDLLYFTRCFDEGGGDEYCHIYAAQRAGLGWGKGRIIAELNGAFNSRQPTLSDDGRLMFFSSDKNGPQWGYDIFYSQLEDDVWSTPVVLSSAINTAQDEVFPCLNGDTLYFSSGGHGGMGGLDIYYSFIDEEGKWVRPVNLKYPINSGGDDFAISFLPSKGEDGIVQSGYLASNRSGGQGRDDIYKFHRRTALDKDLSDRKYWSVTLKVLEPTYIEEGNPNSGIHKYVPLANAQILWGDTSITTDITGWYSMEMDTMQRIAYAVSKPNYFSVVGAVDTSDYQSDGRAFVRVVLMPIFYGKEVVLNSIYYDFNQWAIREDARPSLDSLVNILNDNPNIHIRMASHTDCRGDEEFNLALSQRRAQSAIDYLVDMGISRARLVAVGKGEASPVMDCKCAECTEDEHQRNRRTTFEVLTSSN